MARPKKQTVDYFPHFCNNSKSLFIIQTQHGNDGYAFWFKILQLLGKSEGHVFDYNNRDNWLFLLTETHVPEDKALQILETLASVGSIDKELWQKKIIWSQNFVDNVADVYIRRKVGLPRRPGSLPLEDYPHAITETDDLKVAGMIRYYEDELGRMPTPPDLENMVDYADNYPDGWFEKAVDEVKNSPKTIRSPMSYIEKVMESWKVEGVNPLETGRKPRAHKQQSTKASDLKESADAPLR